MLFQPERLTPVSPRPIEECISVQEDPADWTDEAKTPSYEASDDSAASTFVSETCDSVETDGSDGECVLDNVASPVSTTDSDSGNPWYDMDDGDERFSSTPGTSPNSDTDDDGEEKFFDAEE
jgi:hypothetical protein